MDMMNMLRDGILSSARQEIRSYLTCLGLHEDADERLLLRKHEMCCLSIVQNAFVCIPRTLVSLAVVYTEFKQNSAFIRVLMMTHSVLLAFL